MQWSADGYGISEDANKYPMGLIEDFWHGTLRLHIPLVCLIIRESHKCEVFWSQAEIQAPESDLDVKSSRNPIPQVSMQKRFINSVADSLFKNYETTLFYKIPQLEIEVPKFLAIHFLKLPEI